MKYEFIAAHTGEYSIQRMCRVLQVSASGYYDWRKREPSARERANEVLWGEIQTVYENSRCTYGSPRVHAALQQTGISCGRHRVARLMRKNGLKAYQQRRKNARDDAEHIQAKQHEPLKIEKTDVLRRHESRNQQCVYG